MKIRVTATLSYEYDTEDGLVNDTDEALFDVEQMIVSGPMLDQFQIKAEVTR